MVDVPIACGVNVFATTVATAGFDDVKVHQACESDVGGIRVRLPTLSFMIVILPKVPIFGSSATTVRIMCAEAAFQLLVLDCVAVISAFPPSSTVTVFPLMDTTAGFDEVNDQLPLDVDVGGVSIKVF